MEKINKRRLLSNLKTMDYDDETSLEELEYHISWFDSLPDTLKLYRIVISDNIKTIDLKKPGNHYGLNKKDLLSAHSFLSGIGDHLFLIIINAKKDQIDVNETLSNRILYPHENEITLKDKGRGSTIISVIPLN